MAGKTAEFGVADFDWSSIGKKQDQYSSDDRAKMEDLYEKTLKTINDLQTIEGTVVAMNSREVVVNIGFKSDGVISLSEFKYNPELKVKLLKVS
jgi:small subunit ribosomal protein S1